MRPAVDLASRTLQALGERLRFDKDFIRNRNGCLHTFSMTNALYHCRSYQDVPAPAGANVIVVDGIKGGIAATQAESAAARTWPRRSPWVRMPWPAASMCRRSKTVRGSARHPAFVITVTPGNVRSE